MNPFDTGQTSLLTILINIAFGFVAALMFFIGFELVVAYGKELAEKLFALSGYGQQMAAFGFATSLAPYVVLAPIATLAVKELSSIRTIKSFLIFGAAVAVGVAIAYFTQGYFAELMAK